MSGKLSEITRLKGIIITSAIVVFVVLYVFFYLIEQPLYSAKVVLTVGIPQNLTFDKNISIPAVLPLHLPEVVKSGDFIKHTSALLKQRKKYQRYDDLEDKLQTSLECKLENNSILYIKAVTDSQEDSINFSNAAADVLLERTSVKFLSSQLSDELTRQTEQHGRNIEALRQELISLGGTRKNLSLEELNIEIEFLLKQKISISSELRFIITNLNTRQNKLLQIYGADNIKTLERELILRCNEYLSQLSSINKNLDDLTGKREKYRVILNKINVEETSQKQSIEALKNLNLASMVSNNLNIIERASIFNNQQVRANLLLMALLSLSFGISLGLISSVSSRKLHDIQDVHDYSGFKILGTVPTVKFPLLGKKPTNIKL